MINVQSKIQLFADDILLYRTIKTPNDQNILQDNLNNLTKWGNDWMIEMGLITQD